MIKPLEEYSPEDRAFVEWVEQLRSRHPDRESRHKDLILWDPGPIDTAEIEAILARLRREDGE